MKKILFINFIFIIFIISFLEIAARFFNLSNLMGIDQGLIYEKNDNYFNVPNSTGLIFDAKVFIDENGYRVPSESFKYDGYKNILFIGDSTTFGNGVIEEETFVGILRKDFKKLNFINTAVLGHQIKNYEKKLNIFKEFKNVEKIIYVITLNDVFSSSNISNLANEKKADLERSNEFWTKLREVKIVEKINFTMRNKSYLYMYIKGKFSDPSKRWFMHINKFYKENEIFSLKDLILKLKEIPNAELYIVTLPYEYQTRKCSEDDLYPQKKIEKLLSDIKINYFDFTKYFCDSNNPKNKFYKFDPMHFSYEGHKFVHELLKDKIKFN